MAYHVREIPTGVYGDFSKIQEEYTELVDAIEQGSRILELVELSDLYGAIEGYIEKHFDMTMDDIRHMAEITRSSFQDGTRKSK